MEIIRKTNCWEFKKCGRESGGENASEQICPVSIEQKMNGVHHGKNAGRCCWIVVEDIFKSNQKRNTQRNINCLNCDFYRMVRNDEIPECKVTASFDQYNKYTKG